MPIEERARLDLLLLSSMILKKTRDIYRKVYPDELSWEYGYIISYLCEKEEENIFQRDIEKHFDMNRSTVSSILKKLEREGLVERRPVTIDARLKKVVPTQGARMIDDACRIELDRCLQGLTADVSDRDMDVFYAVISAMTAGAADSNKERDKSVSAAGEN